MEPRGEAGLRVVPPVNEHGEVLDLPWAMNEITRLKAIVEGQQRDLRGWMQRYQQATLDTDLLAREHALWPLAQHLFWCWQVACRHPKATWTESRFWLVEPFLLRRRFGQELEARYVGCAKVIMGAKYDAFTFRRKNGTTRKLDEWDRIFGGIKDYEEYQAKAPKDWQPTLSPDTRALIGTVEERLKLQRKRKR